MEHEQDMSGRLSAGCHKQRLGAVPDDSVERARPVPPAAIVVAASRQIHSPRASRRRCTVSSGLMNSHSSHDMTAEMPLPESATASRRWSPVGSSPSTTGTASRVQAVAGPLSFQPPAAKRSSTAAP